MRVQDAIDAGVGVVAESASKTDGGLVAAFRNTAEFVLGPDLIARMQTWDFWLPLVIAIAAVAVLIVIVRGALRQYFAERLRFEKRRFRAYYEERMRFEKLRAKPTRGTTIKPDAEPDGR